MLTFILLFGVLSGVFILIRWLKDNDDLSLRSAAGALAILVFILVFAVLLLQCKGKSKCNHQPLVKKTTSPYCTKKICTGPPNYEPLTRIVVYERGLVPANLLDVCPHAPIIVVKRENELECKYHKDGLPPDFRGKR